MSTPDALLKTWMDERKLRAADVAERLGVSQQTIHNWRSQGVPPRRQNHVRKILGEWDKTQLMDAKSPIPVRATAEQFDRWNRASMAKYQTIEEWAVDGLEKMAESQGFGTEPLSLVANDEAPYRVPNGTAGNG